MKRIKLGEKEAVRAVIPNYALDPEGPPLKVVVVMVWNAAEGRVRHVVIQEDDMSPELRTLFPVGEAVCTALIRAVPVDKSVSPKLRVVNPSTPS
jgi:hypothetical protein